MARDHRPPLLEEMHINGADLTRFVYAAHPESQRADRYLTWKELRYRRPPEGLSNKEWWWGLKLQRMLGRLPIPLTDRQGKNFSYSLTSCGHKLLHEIDMLCGGNSFPLHKPESKSDYLLYSLEEEAIMSSFIEGAVTTRARAKAMIRQCRQPLSQGERMIFNNYKAMQFIQEIRDEDFSPERILELHRLLTRSTLESSQQEGALRSQEDQVRVEHSMTGEIVHLPPDADQLPSRMESLCHFANSSQQAAQQSFTHPLIRACILHFWLAYDHPFVDGNGRTARAIFYWAMLQAGYRDYEYISISREILNKPKRYYQSFLDTELDEGDLNYFILGQLFTIKEAVENLHLHIERKKQDRARHLEHLLRANQLNVRQKALLIECTKNGEAEFSARSLAELFGVTRHTARTDLLSLSEMGLLEQHKRGNINVYRAAPQLSERLDELGGGGVAQLDA